MKNENEKVLNLDEIETQIKFLSCYRGEQRQQRIKTTSINLHRTLKSFGYKVVTRKFLLTFFSDLKLTSKINYFNEVLKYLLENDFVKVTQKEKVGLRLKNLSLNSFINKNGCSVSTSPLSLMRVKYKFKVLSYKLL